MRVDLPDEELTAFRPSMVMSAKSGTVEPFPLRYCGSIRIRCSTPVSQVFTKLTPDTVPPKLVSLLTRTPLLLDAVLP